MVTNKKIPLVDSNDNIINVVSKEQYQYDAYTRFSALQIIVGDQFLITQRSSIKQTNTLRFSLSVMGIVYQDESYEDAIKRKMRDELGINVACELIDKKLMLNGHTAMYVASLDHIMLTPNKQQVARVEYMAADELYDLLDRFPYLFSPYTVEALYLYKKQLMSYMKN